MRPVENMPWGSPRLRFAAIPSAACPRRSGRIRPSRAAPSLARQVCVQSQRNNRIFLTGLVEKKRDQSMRIASEPKADPTMCTAKKPWGGGLGEKKQKKKENLGSRQRRLGPPRNPRQIGVRWSTPRTTPGRPPNGRIAIAHTITLRKKMTEFAGGLRSPNPYFRVCGTPACE